jgi:CxxC-x17-CxxC domain-containing protein
MGKFNREGGFGGGKKFGGRDRSYDRNAPREMHHAICAECGSSCEVPFKPSGDRPVLCSSCFKNGKGSDRREERQDSRREFRPRNDDKEMFDATCAECGQHCQVPFRPKPGRDIFCSDCFGRENNSEPKPFVPSQASKSVNYDKHFESLHAKLDKLITLLTPKSDAPIAKPAAVKPVAVKPIEVAVKKEEVKPVAKIEKKAEKKVEKKEVKKASDKKKVSKKK